MRFKRFLPYALMVFLFAIVCLYNKPILSYLKVSFIGGNTSQSNEIVLWHVWGGRQKELMEQVIHRFEETHPGVHVRLVFASNNLASNQKFFTAVAAHKPPDLIFVDGPQVSEWASQGSLQPIDDRLAKAGIKSSDFFKPCWAQCSYENHTWALTYCADPNFAFAWNKSVFRDAHLDPNKPPQTIADLDRMNDLITKQDKSGISRMGLIPWAQNSPANTLFTWGWAFGGSFYDEKHHRVTADDPHIVAALTWMVNSAKKYDVRRVSSMMQGFGNMDQNPLYIGKIGMGCFHISQIEDARTYAPKLDYGLTYVPSPPNGEKHSSWIGGWCLAIPKGSSHPDLAWELMKWLCATKEGTNTAASVQSLLPGYKKSPYLEAIRHDPRLGIYVDILQECKHQRPVMPAQAYYMGALDRAVDFAIYGQKSPKQALRDARVETQHELDLRLAGR